MRDTSGLAGMDGAKYLASVPKGEVIISMVSRNGELFIATEKHVYKLVDEKRLEEIH